MFCIYSCFLFSWLSLFACLVHSNHPCSHHTDVFIYLPYVFMFSTLHLLFLLVMSLCVLWTISLAQVSLLFTLLSHAFCSSSNKMVSYLPPTWRYCTVHIWLHVDRAQSCVLGKEKHLFWSWNMVDESVTGVYTPISFSSHVVMVMGCMVQQLLS
jgi:hypothetical protein